VDQWRVQHEVPCVTAFGARTAGRATAFFFNQAFRMQFNGPRGQRIQITTADFISGHLTKLVTVCSPTCPCRLSTSPGFDSLVLLCLAFAPWNFSLTSFFSRRHAAFFSNYRPQFYRFLTSYTLVCVATISDDPLL
jgi:hypothetical protein